MRAFVLCLPLVMALSPPAKKSVAIRKVVGNVAASVALATALVTPMSAEAARSGGRAGGSSFRSAPSRSMPSRSAPRVAPRTSVRTYAVPVPVPASPFGGFGGGYGYSPFGGYGNTGAYLGISLIDSIIQEQRRAAIMRQQLETQQQLGKDQGEIATLKAQLDAQDKRIAELQEKAKEQK